MRREVVLCVQVPPSHQSASVPPHHLSISKEKRVRARAKESARARERDWRRKHAVDMLQVASHVSV
jgi:hypothetical protein